MSGHPLFGCSDGSDAQNSCYYKLFHNTANYYAYYGRLACTCQSLGPQSAAQRSSTNPSWKGGCVRSAHHIHALEATCGSAAIAAAATVEPIATSTTSPALTCAALLGTAAQCSS